MADVDFRVKFPYRSNVISTPVIVNTEEPVFTSLNTLNITDNLPAGKYHLIINYSWSMPDTNDAALFRVISPVTSGDAFRREPKDADDVENRTILGEVDWVGGTIQFEFEGSITVGGQTLTVQNSQLIFERKV